MKSATVAMKGHLGGDCTTLARLYKIVRKDGTTLAYTDHDKNIVYNDGSGALTYEAAVGFSPTAIENKSDLSVDNQDVTAFIDSITIKENELRYGVWDSADIEIRVVNWADLSMGEIKMRKGELGNLHMKNGVLTVEVLGLTNKLQILQGRSYGSPCDAELGDARCKATVPVESSSVNTPIDAHHFKPNSGLTGAGGHYTNLTSGTLIVNNPNCQTESSVAVNNGTIASSSTTLTLTRVTKGDGTTAIYIWFLVSGPAPVAGQSLLVGGFSATNNGTFTINWVQGSSSSVWVAGFYDDGFLTFTSGLNSGLSFQIDQWDGITLRLKNALFQPPSPGDTFQISPGCAHNVADCHNKFNNLDNHRGFPTIPGQDSILQYPDAKG